MNNHAQPTPCHKPGSLAGNPLRPGLWRRLVRLIILGIIAIAVCKWVLAPIRIVGISMEPSYRDGTLHLINRVSYRFRRPRRGEVVVVEQAGTRAVWLARIVGLPNERVAIVQNAVCVDGVPLKEPYATRSASAWDREVTALGAQQYFLIGDNRSMDQDAHEMGAVEARSIFGKILF